MLLLNLPTCVYCGNRANSCDHLVALPHRDRKRDLPLYMSYEVPSCVSCNATANSTFFPSFELRAKYLRARAAHRNRLRLDVIALTEPYVLDAIRNPPSTHNACRHCGTPLPEGKTEFCSYVCKGRRKSIDLFRQEDASQ